MSTSDLSTRQPRYLLPAFCWFAALWMLFFRLGSFPLIEPDEGRNAEVSREMLSSGAWLVPTLNGLPYLDKPAFFFRSVALSMSLFGQNETAARLPGALCGVGMLAMLFGFCRRRYGEPAASLAVLIGGTAPLFFAFSRLVIMDTMLGLFFCGCVFSACIAEDTTSASARRRWYLLSAAAAGCATLVKGPVGFLVPGLIVAVFNRVDGRRGATRRCFSPLHIGVFLAVVLPWFVSLCLRRPDFLYYGLVEESLRRFTSGGGFRHAEPFYYYLPLLIAGLFPWSLILPESVVLAWKRRNEWRSADRLFIVWALVTVVFFSISRTKQPAYVLPAVIALAALLGRLIAYALEHRDTAANGLVRRAVFVWTIVCALLCVGAVLVAAGAHVAVRVPSLKAALPAGAVAVAAMTILSVVAYWRRSLPLGLVSLALFSVCLIPTAFPILKAYARDRSARDLATELASLPEGTEVAFYRHFPAGVAFYQRRLFTLFDTGRTPEQLRSNYLLALWRRGGLESGMVLDVNRVDSWTASRSQPIFLVTSPEGRYWLTVMAGERGLDVRHVASGRWGLLIPTRAEQ